MNEAWEAGNAMIVSLEGGVVIVLALSSWLRKVWASRPLKKDPAKKLAEIERLRSELDRTTPQVPGETKKRLLLTKLTWRERSRFSGRFGNECRKCLAHHGA
jgi:hypothetical protein